MARIVIDAGHGGDDPGAVGNGIIEKELNLKISQYMYNRLKELGIPVKIVRNTDETISPADRAKRIVNAYGDNNDVIVVSNHINAGGGDGAEVIYALRNTNVLSDLILEELEKEGQNIRKAYQRRLPSDTSKDYYFIHRDTGKETQPVIIEYGFLDSTADDVSQLKNNYEKYAEAVVRAISEYANISYIPIAGSNEYTVKSGDSLWGIAKKYGVTVDELKTLNNLTSNALTIGQLLRIPTKKEAEAANYIIYTVKSGDSIYQIAKNYNVTINEIKEFNKLNSNLLNIGQQLIIPIEQKIVQTQYNTYVVKTGDSLYSVAKKYNISVDELKNINNLQSNLLSVGQQLLVPVQTQIIEDTEIENYDTYVVKKGDNLYTISKQYGVSVDEVMNYNNLKTNLLSIGQVLKIPTTGVIYYIVKSGDNLYSIANKYNTTVSSLKEKNNLTSNLLSIGQQLLI